MLGGCVELLAADSPERLGLSEMQAFATPFSIHGVSLGGSHLEFAACWQSVPPGEGVSVPRIERD